MCVNVQSDEWTLRRGIVGNVSVILLCFMEDRINIAKTRKIMGFIPRIHGWFNTCRTVSVILLINKSKNKNHMIINRWRKRFWQNSTSIYDKNSQQSGYREILPQHNKSHIWKWPYMKSTHLTSSTTVKSWKHFI